MKVFVLVFAAAFVLAPIAADSKPAPARDWSRTVVATPAGGFRMGNPDARVKLVEYGSLACPHCREFEETGYAPLVRNYVRAGEVSYEFRDILLNAPDMAATLLAHCAGPARFFPMVKAVYDAQPQWFGKVAAISPAQAAELERMSDSARIVRLADIAGLAPIAARFGMTGARVRRCLADPTGLKHLLEQTQSAEDSGIDRTPTFLIGGKVTDAATWEDLEPELIAAGAPRPHR